MNESKIDQLNREKASFKKQVTIAKAIRNLQSNPDYQLVIDQAFMVDECARYARISGLVTRDDTERADALLKAQAAGHFAEWLSGQLKLGSMAEESLHGLEQIEHEILAESHKA